MRNPSMDTVKVGTSDNRGLEPKSTHSVFIMCFCYIPEIFIVFASYFYIVYIVFKFSLYNLM